MLECADGSYYVGSARGSLEVRIGQHQTGEIPGYTSIRRPVRLVWSQDFDRIVDAIAFERPLKGWSRAKKNALIKGDYELVSRLAARRKRRQEPAATSFETRPSGAPQDEGVIMDQPSGCLHSPRLTIIVAAAENGVIGRAGGLPWHLPDDLKRFKALTMGKPCIMGRKTWDSLPRKPLPGRSNIVVSRNPNADANGARLAGSFEEALSLAGAETPDEIMVIGGEAIFVAALSLADKIELTEISGAIEGDARMPAIDRRVWREVRREGPLSHGDISYSYITLERAITR